MLHWIAEEVPAPGDLRASARTPRVLAARVSECHARDAVAERLERISNLQVARRRGQFNLYRSAADTIRHGAESVQISGRVFRLRLVGAGD